MSSAPFNLLLYYVGIGYVLFMMWVIVLSAAVQPDPPWTRAATTALHVVGIAHPAGALAAWDVATT